jgi:Excalibur calcium-binding domain
MARTSKCKRNGDARPERVGPGAGDGWVGVCCGVLPTGVP